jgi:predicted amidophosphoribosyltransferase
MARRWRYGVDPARELAVSIARISGVPVVAALAAGWWHAARAGPTARHRGTPRFRRIRDAEDWVLIDDVLTTGTTLLAAASCLEGTGRAVVATLAPAASARCG